jgi:hypothetical protein
MASNDLAKEVVQECKKADEIMDSIDTQLDKLDYLFEMQVRDKIKKEYGSIYAEKVKDTEIGDLLHLVGLKKSDFY